MLPPSEDGLTAEEVIFMRRNECNIQENLTDGFGCPKEFDGWTCINATSPGAVIHVPCPYFIFGFDPKRLGHRTCLEDGTWFRHPDSNKTWTNYTTCVDTDDLKVYCHCNRD
ncbi:calcitonin gene-related peptide type 1 receptor-like [Cimex lectularius]|uniref:G-protein coupled receptors family 2 profile 1 domain-containing protein n=1 Tax=Cimex lectularius TaxID=79782 RepID=A0A8I6SRI2_CIMLE|nr:calcitonin gene-related peptide type 1 receptor-like [Cimex lectularius]